MLNGIVLWFNDGEAAESFYNHIRHRHVDIVMDLDTDTSSIIISTEHSTPSYVFACLEQAAKATHINCCCQSKQPIKPLDHPI